MNHTKTVQIIQPSLGPESNKIIKVAAYCRVSSDSDDQANSFLSQVKYYTDFINANDHMKLVDVYADEGITGTSMKMRDDFQRMMRDCKLGKINRILVKSVSRFARNSLECLEAIRQLKDYGVSVLFENDNIDTATMNSEMILYVKSAFAQSEALSCSKRMVTAYRMKMENGDFITCCAPYGYRLEDGNLIIEPKEAEVVKRIFQMFVTGKGTAKIADCLNREGLIGKNHWSHSMIQYILTNEKYIGDSILQKTYTPPILPHVSVLNKGEIDKYYIKGTQEPIIEKDIFDAAQNLLRRRSASKTVNTSPERTLSRKMRCGSCGWLYTYHRINGKIYWLCPQKGVAGSECNAPKIREDKIYRAFIDMYNKLRCFENVIINQTIGNLEKLRNLVISQNKELSDIDSQIADLCEQNNRYEKYHKKKIMDDISFIEQTDRLNGKIEELRKKKKTLLHENIIEKEYDELNQLKDILSESPVAIMEFDHKLFDAIVKQIYIFEDGTLNFMLLGGMELKGKVEVVRKWQSEQSPLDMNFQKQCG